MKARYLIILSPWLFLVHSGCGSRVSTADAAKAQRARSKAAILRVLNADQDLSKIYTTLAPDSTPSQVAVAVGKYCEALEKLDMDDCPADFRVAYRQHTCELGGRLRQR